MLHFPGETRILMRTINIDTETDYHMTHLFDCVLPDRLFPTHRDACTQRQGSLTHHRALMGRRSDRWTSASGQASAEQVR